MHSLTKKAAGFSLVELLLSVGILFILFSLFNGWFLKKQRSMEFEIASDDLYNQLYEAREHSRNYKNGSVYGVRLETDKYEWFKGDVYSSTGVIITSELPAFLQITSVSLNWGGNDVIFEKNTWKSLDYGSFKLVSDDGQVIKIEINSQWLINTVYAET